MSNASGYSSATGLPLVCPRCRQPLPPAQCLSAREWDVLLRVAQGARVREVAAVLCVSIKTVESHIVNARRKLRLPSQARLVAWAWQSGLVTRLCAEEG